MRIWSLGWRRIPGSKTVRPSLVKKNIPRRKKTFPFFWKVFDFCSQAFHHFVCLLSDFEISLSDFEIAQRNFEIAQRKTQRQWPSSHINSISVSRWHCCEVWTSEKCLQIWTSNIFWKATFFSDFRQFASFHLNFLDAKIPVKFSARHAGFLCLVFEERHRQMSATSADVT